jgi:salicylate hydroxylase
MHVIIVGAGIGGLTTALSCLRHGMRVTLLEQAKELREIGAGVQISSNGASVLRELGLSEEVERVAVKPITFRVLSFETGDLISDMPLGKEAEERYGAPFYQFHRADLLATLTNNLPPNVLRIQSRVEDFTQDESSVTVVLANGERISGDVLVGADGIHSVVRPRLVGDGPTTFSGKLVWRALISADRLIDLDFKERFYGWAGLGRMVWAYWVRPGEIFNFGGVVPSSEVRREAWSQTGELDELRASFAGANPRLASLIDRIDEAFITGLYDRDPLPVWTSGRATLLGDAAHAMLPYLAQGATQSIEDGFVLAECLGRCGQRDIPGALAAYELKRRPRTTKVQTVARATHIFWTEGDPVQVKARDGRMKGLAQIDPLATTIWKWLYAYNPVEAARTDAVVPDKRGIRSVYPEDGEEQKLAWNMWHDLFTAEEESRGISGLRRGYDRFFSQFGVSRTTSVEEVKIGNAAAVWVRPGESTSSKVVLHFHGGGFAFGSANCSTEYCERIASAVNGRCLALEYRLAPENPFPAALEDGVAAYQWLLKEGYRASDIFLSGESAGAGLAVATAVALRNAGISKPAGIILLSPFVDCALKSPSIDASANKDPIIDRDILTYMATSYFQSHSPIDPAVSPVYADLKGLAPLLIQAGSKEVLVDDAIRLADQAKSAGVDVVLSLYQERLHIFSLYPFLPNAKNALAEIKDFAARVSPDASHHPRLAAKATTSVG